MRTTKLTLVLIGLLFPFAARPLTTAYVGFEHPDGWRCELSQGVWICQSSLEADRKESVVLSIATMATEWDTLDNYEEYLKQPRSIQDEQGNTLTSKVTYVRKRNINGVQWVDSLQFNSELPGFWARYVATIQNKLAILITYIVSDEKYAQLAPQFERMVSSLKPNAEFNLNIPSSQGEVTVPGSDKLGAPNIKKLIGDKLNVKGLKDTTKEEVPAEEGEPVPLSTYVVMGIALASVVYLLRRRKTKKSGETSKAAVTTKPKDGKKAS